jgi:hypothetical protein
MIKYSRIILIAIVAFSCEKNVSNDRHTLVENRKIKMIMESIHDPILKAGEFEVSPKLSKNSFPLESYFSQKGILLRKSTFNSKGNLESKILFKYDENNNNIECITYHSDGSLASKKLNKFDSENRLFESHEFDAREKITSKKTTRYDSGGYRILTCYERISRGLVKTLESVFDEHENNVANYYFSDEELESKEIKQYDVNGNLFETIQYYPLTNEQVITRFKYDRQNNIVGVIVLKNNLVTTKTISRYDSKNNLTETSSYGVMGTLEGRHKYLYEFDAEGNWTKRINIFNDQPTSVLRRRIEYY